MALIECHECGGKISDTAAACPHCGAPLRHASGDVDFNAIAAGGREEQTGPTSAAPVAKRKSRAGFWLGILGVFIVLGIIGRAVSTGSGSSSSSRSDTTFTAEYGAREIVKEFLKAPSTASFVSTKILERTTAGYCLVRIVVDAENSFGAKLRSTFTVILRLVGDNYSYKRELAAIEEEVTGERLELFKAMNGWK